MEQGEERDEIIQTLRIDKCSPELQEKILAAFGKILFKRLLLLLPDDVAQGAIREMTALPLSEGMERLIALIDLRVENGASRRGEALEQTIAEFCRTDEQ